MGRRTPLVDGCSEGATKAPFDLGSTGARRPHGRVSRGRSASVGSTGRSPWAGGCNGGGKTPCQDEPEAVRGITRAHLAHALSCCCVLPAFCAVMVAGIKESLTQEHAINHREFAAAQEKNLRDYRDAECLQDGLFRRFRRPWRGLKFPRWETRKNLKGLWAASAPNQNIAAIKGDDDTIKISAFSPWEVSTDGTASWNSRVD